MREIRPPPDAFLFFGVFTGFPELFGKVKARLESEYGPLHARGESPTFTFPETRTYHRTMGSGLLRKFFVPARRWPQHGLAPVKLRAVSLEREIAAEHDLGVERPVNIDPGLINDCRIILASTKDYSHRLHRAGGIYEEVTLIFEHGAYRPLPWTYPDFKNPGYHAFFEPLREEIIRGTAGS